jgi:hypothetical protein
VIRIELEVDEPLGEYKHITLVELGEQLVVWVASDEANIEGALKHSEDLVELISSGLGHRGPSLPPHALIRGNFLISGQ